MLLLSAIGCGSMAWAQLDPPGYASWGAETAAVQTLWNARLTYNRPWVWGTTNANLDPTIGASINRGSGLTAAPPLQLTASSIYLIPKVSIRSASLPRGLHHLAAALLTANPGNTAPLGFYPAYTDNGGIATLLNTAGTALGAYAPYLHAHTRSRYDNVTGYLPAVATPVCPPAVTVLVTTQWNAGTAANPAKQLVMNALNAMPALPAVTNAQKWHCFAMRAAPPGITLFNVASGYIELDHPDGAMAEYTFAAPRGRLVYDYVNGRVFYTPTHYYPTYFAAGVLTVSANYNCPVATVCANPFFEIVQ
jgi:hypothetical protein